MRFHRLPRVYAYSKYARHMSTGTGSGEGFTARENGIASGLVRVRERIMRHALRVLLELLSWEVAEHIVVYPPLVG
jgi:hypothetical protein